MLARIIAIAAICAVAGTGAEDACAPGQIPAVIDFDPLDAGAQPPQLCFGYGMRLLEEPLDRYGMETCLDLDSDELSRKKAYPNLGHMIFDSACGGPADGTDDSGCTGNDQDLFYPSEGKVLIFNGDSSSGSSDPNDHKYGGTFFFYFNTTSFEEQFSNIHATSITLLDYARLKSPAWFESHREEDGTVVVERVDQVLVTPKSQYENELNRVALDFEDMHALKVRFDAGGAIAKINLCLEAHSATSSTSTTTSTSPSSDSSSTSTSSSSSSSSSTSSSSSSSSSTSSSSSSSSSTSSSSSSSSSTSSSSSSSSSTSSSSSSSSSTSSSSSSSSSTSSSSSSSSSTSSSSSSSSSTSSSSSSSSSTSSSSSSSSSTSSSSSSSSSTSSSSSSSSSTSSSSSSSSSTSSSSSSTTSSSGSTSTSTSMSSSSSSTSTSTSTGVCPVGYNQAVINFEDLQAGTQPSQLCFSGGGISSPGGEAPGSTVCASLETSGDNAGAMLFDATCGGQEADGTDRSGCSGKSGAKRRRPGDTDLFQPLQGNVLILQTNRQNYQYSDPNDDRDGGCFSLNFTTDSFAGSFSDVLLSSVTLLDVQNRPATITAQLKDGTETVVQSEKGEDGGIQTVDINADQVSSVDICLVRSGAVDDISLCVAPISTDERLLRELPAVELPTTGAAAGAASSAIILV